MTPSQADALIATLPQPGGLRLHREGDQILMEGGRWGAHSLSAKVSSAERLLAHWRGYVENQGLSLGPDYTPARQALAAGSTERDLRPGDLVSFWSASYSRKGGWRPGEVVRATPKRVLVEFSFKKDIARAKRTGEELHKRQAWKKRDEVRRRTIR